MQCFEVLPIFAWYLGDVESIGDGSVSSPKFCRDERISIDVIHKDIV